jgi:hypothetical protein
MKIKYDELLKTQSSARSNSELVETSTGQATTQATTQASSQGNISTTETLSTSRSSHKQVSANETIIFFWYDPKRSGRDRDVVWLPRHLQAGLLSCCLKTKMRPVLLRYQRISSLPQDVFQQDCSQYLPFDMFTRLLAEGVSFQQIQRVSCDLCCLQIRYIIYINIIVKVL